MDTRRDPQSEAGQTANFRRAVWLQVYLPLIGGAVLVAAAVAWALVGGGGGATTSGMADAALVALLLPAMLVGVLALAAIVLLAVGVGKAIGWIPDRARVVQRLTQQAAQESDRIAGTAARVIMAPKSAWSAIRAIWARRPDRG